MTAMTFVELLTVEDRFELAQGLTLLPDFPLPAGSWRSMTTAVEIIRPDGETLIAKAGLYPSHFQFRDPTVPIERRWRVVVSLQGLTKDQVPIGSRVRVDPAVRDAIVPAT